MGGVSYIFITDTRNIIHNFSPLIPMSIDCKGLIDFV